MLGIKWNGNEGSEEAVSNLFEQSQESQMKHITYMINLEL